MTKREIFDKMREAYNKNNKGAIGYYAMALLAEETKNPYIEDMPEYKLFAPLPVCYLQYKSGRVGSKASGKRIIANMTKIMDIGNYNPYADKQEKKNPAYNVTLGFEQYEPVKEPEVILGVLPEKKKSWRRHKKKDGESRDS